MVNLDNSQNPGKMRHSKAIMRTSQDGNDQLFRTKRSTIRHSGGQSHWRGRQIDDSGIQWFESVKKGT